jgi:hypothetical protein
MERMEGGRVGFIPSISERKRKQPIGVVALVTHDATPCGTNGYGVTTALVVIVTESSPLGSGVVTSQTGSDLGFV